MVRWMMLVVRVLQVMQLVIVPVVVGMVGAVEVAPWLLLEGNIIEVCAGDGEGAVGDAPGDGATGDVDGEGAAGDVRTGVRRRR